MGDFCREVSVIAVRCSFLNSDSLAVHSFNLGQTTTGSTKCVGALAGQDLGLGSNVWLLGDRLVYSQKENTSVLT